MKEVWNQLLVKAGEILLNRYLTGQITQDSFENGIESLKTQIML